jgi:hypothetical protein
VRSLAIGDPQLTVLLIKLDLLDQSTLIAEPNHLLLYM